MPWQDDRNSFGLGGEAVVKAHFARQENVGATTGRGAQEFARRAASNGDTVDRLLP